MIAKLRYNVAGLLCLVAMLTGFTMWGQLTTTPASFGPFCNNVPNTIHVNYTTSNGALASHVQVSDPGGTFPANTTTNLLDFDLNDGPGDLDVILPAGLLPGSYRVRVIDDAGPVVGTDNGNDIVITAYGAQAVTSSGATAIAATTATFNGNLTTLGTCPNTLEKGFVYSLTSTNADPIVAGTGVTIQTVAGLTTGTYTFAATGLTPSSSYKYKAYIYDGTTYTYSAVQTFSTSALVVAPTLTAAAGATVDNTFAVTFTDNPAWRAAITGITVNGVTLTGGYSVTAGQIIFTPSASAPATALQVSGSKSIIVLATGYTNGTATQTLGAGMAVDMAIINQPTAPTANGGLLSQQPSIKVIDQYGNTVTSPGVAILATDNGGSAEWSLGGTILVNTVNGVATFTNLTATSTTSVTGAVISFNSVVGLASSNPFYLPPPPPANNLCAAAVELIAGNAAINGTLESATYTALSSGDNKKDVWYTFTAACNGEHTITLTMGGGYMDLYLFEEICPSNNNTYLASGDSDDNHQVISFNLTAGNTYIIRVTAYDAAAETTFTIGVTSGVSAPTVSTFSPYAVNSQGATLSGNVIAGCNAVAGVRGFVYSTSPNPSIETAANVTSGSGNGSFNSTLTNLPDNTQYYVRAYAMNGGTAIYGTQLSFTTSPIAAPVAVEETWLFYDAIGFSANWLPVTGATGYVLDVSASPTFGTATPATDLFFSEYVEGTGNNKFLELYNGTGTSINLSGYSIAVYQDGSASAHATTINLTGTLANGATFVIKNSAENMWMDNADVSVNNAVTQFTGNDVLELRKNGTAIDRIGTISGGTFGQDTGLRRKSTVISPTTAYNVSQWDEFEYFLLDDLYAHNYTSFTSSYIPGYNNIPVAGTSQHVISGNLTEGNTYYYRVRALSANSTSANSNVITATSTLANVWTPEQDWTLGTPTVNQTTAIEGVYDTGIFGAFDTGRLVVTLGSVVVREGTTQTVQNAIINQGDAEDFIVEEGASLKQVNDVDNTGDFTVQKDSNPLYKLDYTVWSSPVTGQVLQDFSPLTLPNRFYTYAIGTDNEEAYISTSSSGTFQPGIGYLIRMPDHLPAEHPDYDGYELGASGAEGALPYTLEGEYAGNLINGDVPVAMSTQDQFYSMVGNPYASPISVEEFFAQNEDVLFNGQGIYFWRKRNNHAATSYAALTTTSYAANDGGVESGDDPDTYASGGQQWEDYYENTLPSEWVIAPGQGFFVRGNGAAGNLMFTNGMRRNAGTGQPFFRMDPNQQPQLSRLWLNLYSETNFSQASIAYIEGATVGVDYGKDARKFASPNLSLYSVMGEDNFTIQSRPVFEATDVVPMGYNVHTAGTYSIALHRKDGVFDDGQNVYLKDTQLDIIHDFSEGLYTFATEAGTFNERFRVVYSDGALGTYNPAANNNNIVVYCKENVLNVHAGNNQISDITVYDLRGRIIYTKNNINSPETVLKDFQPQEQVLIVKVTTSEGIVNKKVIY